jgi:hypothetical protein
VEFDGQVLSELRSRISTSRWKGQGRTGREWFEGIPRITKTYYGFTSTTGVEVQEIEADGHRLQVPIKLVSNREAFEPVLDALGSLSAYVYAPALRGKFSLQRFMALDV